MPVHDAPLAPLQSIELREIRLPLKEPFVASHGTVHDKRILLLKLTDADGTHAWSECVALADPSYLPETLDTCWLALCEWVGPRALGLDSASPRGVHQALTASVRGHAMARAAVEMGCWTLAAERRGASLSTLLGGTRPEVATGLAIGIELDRDRLATKVRTAIAEGYRRLKLKIRPGWDVEPLRTARRVAGEGFDLIADANSAYRLEDAEHLARFDAFGLSMIEQPLGWEDLSQHAELQRQLATPICLDESITSLARAADMVALGSGQILNLKPGRVGGFSESLAIHQLCRKHGIALWCGGMLESGIGRAYNVALASLPGFTLPGDLSPSQRYWERDVVTPEWTMSAAGRVAVPEASGLGVEVDRDRIEDLTVRRHRLTGD
ncbi:MAG: o-succinylbenzoate synthase [Acidobacteriota bacterium]